MKSEHRNIATAVTALFFIAIVLFVVFSFQKYSKAYKEELFSLSVLLGLSLLAVYFLTLVSARFLASLLPLRSRERFSITHSEVNGVNNFLHRAVCELNNEYLDQLIRNRWMLSIGVIVSAVGFGFLIYFLVNLNSDISVSIPKDPEERKANSKFTELLAQLNFIAIMLFSILIQVFAFFFLYLYRSGPHELRIIQNEIINLYMKLAAQDMMSENENVEVKGLKGKMVRELMSSERNFKLKKGESTIQIERERGSSNLLEKLIERMKFSSN